MVNEYIFRGSKSFIFNCSFLLNRGELTREANIVLSISNIKMEKQCFSVYMDYVINISESLTYLYELPHFPCFTYAG